MPQTTTALILTTLLAGSLLGCAGSTSHSTDAGSPKIRVLGTAQDGGFPHVACRCDRCVHARQTPAAARQVASIALLSGEKSWIFDATPDIRTQLEMLFDRSDVRGRVDRNPVDGLFLTHAHLGHYTGLGFFGFEAMHSDGMPLFATEKMHGYLQQNGPWSQLYDLNNVKPQTLMPGSATTLDDGVQVTPFLVPHRDEFADTVGYLIEGPNKRLFYVPDTDGWDAWEQPIESWLRDQKIDILLADATFYSMDELPRREVSSIGHPLVVDSMERLQPLVDAGALQVFFTHFNHSNPLLNAETTLAEQLRERGFEILQDGQEIGL